MQQAITLTEPTLCIGVDITWWGGSPNKPASQRDTIVYGIADLGAMNEVRFRAVDLSAAPNPNPSPTDANFDASGSLLVKHLTQVITEHRGCFTRCVLAIDAPLEAFPRPNQPPRVKAVGKGMQTGALRRQCEHEIERFKTRHSTAEAKSWHRDVRIQSGSPLPPRVTSILNQLSSSAGFRCWGHDRRRHTFQVIEVFPSEAIWALGVLNGYPSMTSQDVRRYKLKKPSSLELSAARRQALAPLLGFAEYFGNDSPLPFRRWCDDIASFACAVATDARRIDVVRKGKGFDDPIDSGIAFLTAVTFASEAAHAWGDGTDGTIVGPGILRTL
jgi:hypothetical protein